MGDFGLPFVQGAAFSSSDTQLASLPPCVVWAPPMNAVCDPTVFALTVGYSGSVACPKKRDLTSSSSDTSKHARGGVTCALLDMRTDALAAIKAALQVHGAARSNMVARWQAFCKAGHAYLRSAPEDMAAWITTFQATLAYLKGDAKKDVVAWTLSTAAVRRQDLTHYIAKIEELSASIGQHAMAADEVAKRRRKEALSDSRKAQWERTRLLSPWRSSHVAAEARVPMPFLRFMLEHG